MIPEGLRELLESEDDAVFDQGKEIAMTLNIPQEEVVAALPIARLVEQMDAAPSDLWVRTGRAMGHGGRYESTWGGIARRIMKDHVYRMSRFKAMGSERDEEAKRYGDLVQRSEEVRATRKVLSEYEYFYNMGEDEGWDF